MKWVLNDPDTAETWTMPINPDSMSSPHPAKPLRHAYGVRTGLHRARTFMAAQAPVRWTFGGVIRTQAHYDALEDWASKDIVHITDHLARTWVVVMQGFDPVDRRPTPQTPWRLRYQMQTLILRRLS